MPEATLRRRVPPALARGTRKLVRRAKKALRGGDPAALHETRIAVKRLRYELEFFRAVLGPEADVALELLARVQERLGTIADADAFERLYGELLAGLEPSDRRIAGLEARRRIVHQDRERALVELRSIWDDANGESYRERLSASISAAVGSLSPNDAG